MTVDDLATLIGESAHIVGMWQELGLLSCESELVATDVHRARLIQFAVRHGVPPETLAEITQRQDMLGEFLEIMGERGAARWTATDIDEIAREVGLDANVVSRIAAIVAFTDDELFYDDDIAMLRMARVALEVGFPEDALSQLMRVYVDALRRVAEAENRLFHMYVHERLRAEGVAGADLVAATQAAAGPLMPVLEPALLYFHRKAFEAALREDLLLHLRQEMGSPADEIGRVPVSILFVDLASFTPLTEAMGDAAAAEVVDRFSELVRDSCRRHEGRIVKQIGDEFMLLLPDALALLRTGLDIRARTAHEGHFPGVRLGGHAGFALYREGDYVGGDVNLAARVVGEAGRGQFLVTAGIAVTDAEQIDVQVTSLGARKLKGIAEEVELFAVAPELELRDRDIDPVCGMELAPDTETARLSWRGRDVVFCSQTCLQRFVENPELYDAGR